MANKKQNIKNLTLAELKRQSKKLDAKEKHEVVVGDTIYKVEIDTVFRKTKQYALLDDLVAFFDAGNKNPLLLDLATPYVSLLFVKHFTSVEVSDNIDEAIELLNVMIDLDLLNQILNLMPEQEVIQVYEILSSTTERMKGNIEETLAEIEKIREQVQNDEVKAMIDNGEEA